MCIRDSKEPLNVLNLSLHEPESSFSSYYNLHATMAAVNGTNGVHGNTKENATKHVDSTNPEFTQHCINAIGPNASPRARELGAALFKHIHAFAREVQLTTVRNLTQLPMEITR